LKYSLLWDVMSLWLVESHYKSSDISYKTTWRHVAERFIHCHRRENLKFYVEFYTM